MCSVTHNYAGLCILALGHNFCISHFQVYHKLDPNQILNCIVNHDVGEHRAEEKKQLLVRLIPSF